MPKLVFENGNVIDFSTYGHGKRVMARINDKDINTFNPNERKFTPEEFASMIEKVSRLTTNQITSFNAFID